MSLWDSFVTIADNITPDDATGWIPEAINGALDTIPGAKPLFQGYDWLLNKENQAGSWAFSALPGGPQTLDWNKAEQVPVGQAAVASGVGISPAFGALTSAVSNMPGRAGQAGRQVAPWTDPSFDFGDDQQRQAAFENYWYGSTLSGAFGGVFSWFTDPLVVGGKALKVARAGGTIGGKSFTGLTDRTIRTANDVETVAQEADAGVLWIKSGGMAGYRTPVGEAIYRTLGKDSSQMLWDPLARNSSNPRLIADLFGETHDIERANLIFKAGIGHQPSVLELERQAASTADAVLRTSSMDAELKAMFKKGVDPANAADYERYKKILDDLAANDSQLQDALQVAQDGVSSGLINRVGNKSWRYEAWNTGRIERSTAHRYDPKGLLGEGTTSAYTSRVFQRNPWVRPVRVVQWFKGEKPSGTVGLKGELANDAPYEIHAAMSDSRVLGNTAEDVAFKQEQVQRFVNAKTPQGRMAVVQSIELRTSRRIADKLGIDHHTAMLVYEDYRRARSTATDFMKQHGFLVDSNGELVVSPVLSSQLVDQVPMMDFRAYERILKRVYNVTRTVDEAGNDVVNAVRRAPGDPYVWAANKGDAVVTFLEGLQSAWKASVLFRLGYTVRNVAEGNLRAAAAFGFFPAFQDPFGSFRRFAHNTRTRAQIGMESIQDYLYNETRWQLNAESRSLVAQRRALAKEHGDLTASTSKEGAGVKAGVDEAQIANEQQQIVDRIAAIDERLNTITDTLAQQAERHPADWRRRYGDDTAFAGAKGEAARRNSSADLTWENTVMGVMSRAEAAMTRANAWTVIHPGDTQYWDELAHVANRQIKADPMAKMILEGAPRQDVRAWVLSSKARQYRREMGLDSSTVDHHINQVTDMIDRYLPDAELRARVASEEVSAQQLQSALRNHSELASIHGRELQSLSGVETVATMYQNTLKVMYKALGSIPENLAVRHPFYVNRWGAEARRLTSIAQAQGVHITEERAAAIASKAHARALKETKETIYTIERYSNPAAVLRWVMPFFPAWENTMRVWLKIGWKDWSVVGRSNLIWDSPNKLGMGTDSQGNPMPMVVDANGNEVPPGSPFNTSQYIRLPLPLAKAFGHLFSDQIPDINKQSLNVILMGQTPWVPGVGPVVTIPFSQVVAHKPELETTLTEMFGPTVYQTLVPFGRPSGDVGDQALPAAVNRLRTLMGGEGNRDFMVTAVSIWRDDEMRWELGGRQGPEPSAADAVRRAQDLYKMRVAANMALPFSIRPRSEYQFYIDRYRQLTQQYGFTEGEKLYDQEFGKDWAMFKRSLTHGTTGMAPTQQAYAAYSANTDVWNKVVGIDPSLGALITNPSGSQDDFSPAVYEWMQGRPVSPGSTVQFRSTQSVADFAKASQVEEGWSDYIAKRAIIDEALQARGLSDLQQTGAEDLNQAWHEYLYQMQSTNNSWWSAFVERRGEARTYDTVRAVKTILADQSFKPQAGTEGLWSAINDYMAARDQVTQFLQQRYAAGGSADFVNAKSNEDVRQVWDQYIMQLKQRDTRFAAFYDRWLDGDNMKAVNLDN